MDIRETTAWIINSDDPAKWLKMADIYIDQYNKLRSGFVLPKEYDCIAALLEVFAKRHADFPDYIRVIRDNLPKGEQSREVNSLYRTVMTRFLQQERRDRVTRAVDKANDLYGPLSAEQKFGYARKAQKIWGNRRLELLRKAARHSSGRRLSMDEKAEILEIFWKEVDDEIDSGNIPPVE